MNSEDNKQTKQSKKQKVIKVPKVDKLENKPDNDTENKEPDNIKKVLSFDVGIINLAYCLLEVNQTKKSFNILNWGIIDLASNRKKCQFIKRGGSQCSSVATRMINVDENKSYYCKSHVKNATLNINDVDVKWNDVNDKNKCSIENCNKPGTMNCNLISNYCCCSHQKKFSQEHNIICSAKKCKEYITKGLYINNENSFSVLKLGWCDEHYEHESELFLKKKTKNMSQNSNKLSHDKLGVAMYTKLDELPELLLADEVLIENQPTFINPTMKTVSAILFSYFVMRGLYEKDKTKSTINNVLFCSPSNKIKVGGKNAIDKLEKTEEKVYKVTKNMGVEFCKALIKDRPEYLQMIDKMKKQDDMADAFLQGFIMNFGPVLPDHFMKMIESVKLDEVKAKKGKRTKKTSESSNTENTEQSNQKIKKKTKSKKGVNLEINEKLLE